MSLSTHAHGGAAGAGNDELAGVDSIAFDNVAASPDAAGELQRNGVNLEWYGAAVVKFTEADAAAATASPRTLGTGALQGAPGNHGHNSSGYTLNSSVGTPTATAGGTTGDEIGYYTLTDTQTVTVHTGTQSRRLGAWVFVVAHIPDPGAGVTLKASIEADGVEVVSLTRSGAVGAIYNVHLVAVVVKPTADIAWVTKLARSGSAGALNVTVRNTASVAAGGTTTTPYAAMAGADLGAA